MSVDIEEIKFGCVSAGNVSDAKVRLTQYNTYTHVNV